MALPWLYLGFGMAILGQTESVAKKRAKLKS